MLLNHDLTMEPLFIRGTANCGKIFSCVHEEAPFTLSAVQLSGEYVYVYMRAGVKTAEPPEKREKIRYNLMPLVSNVVPDFTRQFFTMFASF